jgi:hypothetical protein
MAVLLLPVPQVYEAYQRYKRLKGRYGERPPLTLLP